MVLKILKNPIRILENLQGSSGSLRIPQGSHRTIRNAQEFRKNPHSLPEIPKNPTATFETHQGSLRNPIKMGEPGKMVPEPHRGSQKILTDHKDPSKIP